MWLAKWCCWAPSFSSMEVVYYHKEYFWQGRGKVLCLQLCYSFLNRYCCINSTSEVLWCLHMLVLFCGCLSAAGQKYRPVQHFLANLIECVFKIRILLTPAMAAFYILQFPVAHSGQTEGKHFFLWNFDLIFFNRKFWGVEGDCAESFGDENMLMYKVEIRI